MITLAQVFATVLLLLAVSGELPRLRAPRDPVLCCVRGSLCAPFALDLCAWSSRALDEWRSSTSLWELRAHRSSAYGMDPSSPHIPVLCCCPVRSAACDCRSCAWCLHTSFVVQCLHSPDRFHLPLTGSCSCMCTRRSPFPCGGRVLSAAAATHGGYLPHSVRV